MTMAESKDFIVDLATREVRHGSGAIVSFSEYPTEAQWLVSRVGGISNPEHFQGLHAELLAGAKKAALAAGMTHRKT
jgi:hypothetical protein